MLPLTNRFDPSGVQVEKGDQFAVWASFVEIYNEKVCLQAG
jgi:hypothetical protein